MEHLEVDTSMCNRHMMGQWPVSCSSDGTTGHLIAHRYLHHQFVVISLISRNSARSENKVAYANYTNGTNLQTHTE